MAAGELEIRRRLKLGVDGVVLRSVRMWLEGVSRGHLEIGESEEMLEA